MSVLVRRERQSPDLLFRFRDFVISQNLLMPGKRVLAAVSGGKDSVAMLDLLYRYLDGDGTRLGVIYVNHGWDPNRHEAEQAFVQEIANRCSLRFHVKKIKPSKTDRVRSRSLEAWSRQERYRLLSEAVQEGSYDLCALGHTADDQAETVLMRLLKGSGLLGLAGIPVKREFYIRPLLGFTTQEILDYARFRHLAFLHDPTNRDLRLLRARIRHKVLPGLEHNLNPAVKQALVDLSRDITEWRSEAMGRIGSPIYVEKGKIVLAERPFFSYLDIIRKIWLQEALREASGVFYPLRQHHLISVSRLSGEGKTGRWAELPGGFRLIRDRDRLILAPMSEPESEVVRITLGRNRCESLGIELDVEEVPLSMVTFSGNPMTEWMDYDKLSPPWILRHWKPGDHFHPLGGPGGKKISDFLTDRKISLDDKQRVLVLEAKGEIVWVVGHRISQSVQITPLTQRAVHFEIRSPGRMGSW